MFAKVMREGPYLSYRIRLEQLMGIPRLASDQEIHELIEDGFVPQRVLSLIVLYSQTISESDQINGLKKILRGRPAAIDRLNVNESDQLFRFAHITAMAQVIFGDETKAMRWLSKPKERLGGRKPYELLSTTPGTNEVERMLIQVFEPFAL